MQRNQKTAFVFSAAILLIAIAYAVLYYVFMPGDPKRFIIAVFALLLGTLAAFFSNWLIRKLPDSAVTRLLVLGLTALLIASPFISASMKQVTYSRFGFTVYGLIPIPVLDIIADEDGVLWFRAKTDLITLEEVQGLVDSDTAVIVIANGWESTAQLDDLIYVEYLNLKIHELSTPEAFEKYNELIKKGVKVVLIGHTTC
jgi:hypothetical protein